MRSGSSPPARSRARALHSACRPSELSTARGASGPTPRFLKGPPPLAWRQGGPHPPLMSYLGQLLALSAVVMGIAQTVTKERLFEPLRNRLGGRDSWLGYGLVPLTGVCGVRVQVRWGLVSTLLDWFLSSMLVVVIAAFMRVAFWFVDESQGLVRRRKRVMERVAQEEGATHVRH